MMLANVKINVKDNRSTYPGGKGGSGVYQTIINLIPPHETYIETHLGAGSILRHKRPATTNIGIDIDPDLIAAWHHHFPESIIKNDVAPRGEKAPCSIDKKVVEARADGTASSENMMGDDPGLIIMHHDASSFLKSYQFQGTEFVYVDPPYLMETRKGGKLYDFEYSEQNHIDLLNVLKSLPCMVMISGYWSSLYASMLQGWNTHSFEAQTRQGPATEWVWFNYPFPEVLHDYSYLGDTFRERERIKKKRDRWISRLLNTPALERNALFQALENSLPDPASTEGMMSAVESTWSHHRKW